MQDIAKSVLGFRFGAGGMFCLVVTDLVPEAKERQFDQLSAIATGVSFMAIFALSNFF